MQILRRGSQAEDARRWQHFLVGRELLESPVDGVFGPATEAATIRFQQSAGLKADGVVGPATLSAAVAQGLDLGFTDPHGGTSGLDWPPRPDFAPLVSNAERAEVFGRFEFERIEPGKDAIRIEGDWEARNIVAVAIPQLAGVTGAPASGRIRVHAKVAEQIRSLFAAWEDAGLRALVLAWGGSFVPRYVRGSATTLSNHAWGTAFDINVAWNPRGAVPALRGREGSVRELVPLANELGFYWGGHFERRDGMHFEVARVLG